MAKFVEYRDLFKWNKDLMEEDWNDGQAYVVKHTTKGAGATFTNTAKAADAKSDSHKVALETKCKYETKEFNGAVFEGKIKNNGEVSIDYKFDYLK